MHFYWSLEAHAKILKYYVGTTLEMERKAFLLVEGRIGFTDGIGAHSLRLKFFGLRHLGLRNFGRKHIWTPGIWAKHSSATDFSTKHPF